jgi:hypothetical protein
MSDDHMRYWRALERTDPRFTKSLDGSSGFRGTSVNAMYNIKRVTEQLGPVGQAWGWIVMDERLDTLGEVVVHVVRLRVWFRHSAGSGADACQYQEVDSLGTTRYAYWTGREGDKGRRYLVDHEAPKKSLTDALSKAMSWLGASADIWLGGLEHPELLTDGHDPDTGEVVEHDAPDPIVLVDPSGQKPAAELPFHKAAATLERWCETPARTGEEVQAMLATNLGHIRRLPGMEEYMRERAGKLAEQISP